MTISLTTKYQGLIILLELVANEERRAKDHKAGIAQLVERLLAQRYSKEYLSEAEGREFKPRCPLQKYGDVALR